MSTPNRFGIKECGQATFYDLETDKAVLYLDTLKTSGVEVTSSSVSATGGQGNSKIITWSTGKEVTVTLQDALFSSQGLAIAAGANIVTGATNVYQRDVLIADSSKTITLTKTPVGEIISVYKLNPDGTHGAEFTKSTTAGDGKYTLAAKVLTFSTDVSQGDKFVVYYKISTDETATTVQINSDTFGGTYKLVIDVLVRDAYTKSDYQGQLIFPCCKAQDNFSLSLSAEGDPAVFDIPLDVLKDPTSTEMFKLVIYDLDLAA